MAPQRSQQPPAPASPGHPQPQPAQSPPEESAESRAESPSEGEIEPRAGSGLGAFFGAQPLGVSPFGFMRRMLDDLDRLMGDFSTGAGRSLGRGEEPLQAFGMWLPQIEVLQRGDELIVRADLPGLREEDVQIAIVNDALVIEGERSAESQSRQGDIVRSERTYGRFRREIPLPSDADMESASATFEAGVLEVAVKLPSQRRGRRVEVKRGKGEGEGVH